MHRHLAPATGGAAKVDHPRARHQKAEAVIKLHDLVGGAATKAFLAGTNDIGVVQLAL